MKTICHRIPEGHILKEQKHIPSLLARGIVPQSVGQAFQGRHYMVFQPYAEHIGRDDELVKMIIQIGCKSPRQWSSLLTAWFVKDDHVWSCVLQILCWKFGWGARGNASSPLISMSFCKNHIWQWSSLDTSDISSQSPLLLLLKEGVSQGWALGAQP